MSDVLADQLDALASAVAQQQTGAGQQFQSSYADLITKLNVVMISQQRWVQDALTASEARKKAEALRLNALWWSEALYSPSIRCGYRELPAPLAAVVMALDLLAQVTTPTPASVGYLLAEAVHRLPEAAFDRQRPLLELLGALREARVRLPKSWTERLSPPPAEGRLSLRDLISAALEHQAQDLDGALQRSGLAGNITLSLPVLARAMFRQEQAVQLAGAPT